MNQEIAVKDPQTQAAVVEARFSPEQIAASQLDTAQSIPDLAEAPKHFMPSNVEYWTPAAEGEEKRVFVAGISHHDVADMKTGEIRPLECVMLLERQGDSLMRYITASKVLVGNIKDAIQRQEIIPMSTLTPVAIKYMGQKKNKSNGKLSNRWLITPLVVAVQ